MEAFRSSWCVGLRALLSYDRALAAQVVRAFAHELRVDADRKSGDPATAPHALTKFWPRPETPC